MNFLRVMMMGIICCSLVCCKAKKQASNKNPAAVEQTDRQLDGLSGMLPDNQVERTDGGIRIVFNSAILFNVNSSILTDDAKTALFKMVQALKSNNTTGSLQINGYTDSSGTAEYNVWLSDRRATSVKTYLVSLGLSASEITVKGYGAANPVATNATAEGREKNRRVEVIIAGS